MNLKQCLKMNALNFGNMKELKALLAVLQAMLELLPITLLIIVIASLLAIPLGAIKRKITPNARKNASKSKDN